VAKSTSLAVVMDPIEDIKYSKDSTLAMLLAAQARGYDLIYLTLADLYLRDGVAMGACRPLTVAADPNGWFTLGEPRDMKLGEIDVILMRKDPPFDVEYIYSTYILERAELDGALVVNRPRGLRDMNEKVYTAWFPEVCAPTLISRDMDAMARFATEHGRIVCKPLHGMFETLTDYGNRFAMVQRYLPEIAVTGDTRVLLVDGEPVPYALARMPTATDNRGNLAAGATGVARPLNDRDREIAARIGPVLREAGMLFVGLDVIGGFVTEINVTSPTGIREIDKQFKTDIGALLVDAIDRRVEARARRTHGG
jgi:glutathione synthase